MKIKMTIEQLHKVLQRTDTVAKFPITADLSKVSKAQLEELVELIKKKKG